MKEIILDAQYAPDNHSQQVTSSLLVKRVLKLNDIKTVIDLGCGAGDSVDLFREIDPAIKWVGLDIESSIEVNQRERTDAEFVSFDGVDIPFDDNSFDLIYCHQVLEHVRHPTALLNQVERVLKPGGYFVGATSHLEPYHSHSIWNFTPYGFQLLVEDTGLQLVEVRPSIDSLTLIVRRFLRRHKFFSRWWEKESPFNRVLSLLGKLGMRSHREINLTKLLFCGQFCFVAKKREA